MSVITGILLYDIVGVLIAAVTIFYFYAKYAFEYWKNRGVPYLEPIMFWGNVNPPHRRAKPLGDQIADLYQAAKNNGWKELGWYNMISPVYTPVDLEIIKNIMTKDFNHFTDRGLFYNEKKEPISAHLFLLGGKKWRNLRTKLTPTFTSGKMRMMFQTLADCGIQMEKYLLQELAHHEPIDIKNVLGNFSTDIIGSCAFGLECNSFKDPDSPFREMGKRIFQRSTWQNVKFVISNVFPNFGKLAGITLLDDEVKEFFTNAVVDTVNYREKNQINRNDFLQMLIEIKNNKEGQSYEGDGTSLTINEMVAQSLVFFIAGFETSSTTMTFALYELSKNPDIQQNVRDEINAVLKKYNGKVTYDALNEMKYMGQVIDETLRMYPAVPFITRVCVKDYIVPQTNVELKKGQITFISIKGVHYDEELYPNSKVFDPERFSDENKHDRHQYAHIPFGEGPRICIGMRFGLMQTKVGLISILKNFNLTLNKKTAQPLKFDVNSGIPQVSDGIWLDMEKIV